MAIVAGEGFTVHVSKCRESFEAPYAMKLTVEGIGVIEGTDKGVTLSIPRSLTTGR